MRSIILWIWQLPQNAAGFILSRNSDKAVVDFKTYSGAKIKFYWKQNFFNSGVSLGDYIILDRSNVNRLTVSHEYGHQRQSRILGWLYLPLIGLPSLIGNLYSRATHKSSKWYYRQPWEHWADKLAGIDKMR